MEYSDSHAGTSTAIAILLATLVYVLWPRQIIHRGGRKLPRPPGTLPLAGYGPWFLQPRHKLLDWFASIQPQMGLDTYEIPVPSLPPAVLINDPRNLEFVLKSTDVFVKGKFFRSRSEDLFADGILNADGELWQIQRKAGLRFLTRYNLAFFIDEVLPPIFEITTRRLDDAATSGTVLDLQEELLGLTTRFFGKIAYDMDIDPSMPFSEAFDHASAVTNSRFTNPLWKIQRMLFGRAFRNSCREVRAFGAAVVKRAQEAQAKSEEPEECEKTGESEKSKMAGKTTDTSRLRSPNLITSLLRHISPPATVAAAATNYLSAGRDTTAQALTWTFHALLSHPSTIPPLISALEKHQTSSPCAISNSASHTPSSTQSKPNPPPSTPSSAESTLHLNSCCTSPCLPSILPLLAAFHEALRLRPAVPFEIKETTQPCTLPDGTSLPAGAAVLWIPYAMAHNPQIWGKDASCFEPGRWIGSGGGGDDNGDGDGQGKWTSRTPYQHPVFNGGPRMCVGKNLAEAMAVWILGRLLWEWEFEEVGSDGKPWKGGWEGRKVGESLTAPMEGGLPVRVRRRVEKSLR